MKKNLKRMRQFYIFCESFIFYNYNINIFKNILYINNHSSKLRFFADNEKYVILNLFQNLYN